MRGLIPLWLPLGLTIAPLCSAEAQVFINEVMASNRDLADPDEPGQFPDWVEVYNAGTAPLDLGDLYLTDSLRNPTRWRIPSGVKIDVGGTVLFWADGDEEQGKTHTSFRLSAGGEEVALFNADGRTLLDHITFGPQETGVSYGRFPNGGEWCSMSDPTPAEPNSACRAGSPEFSRAGGMFTDPFQLEITTGSPGATIYYRLDGEEPNDTAGVPYTGPIEISSSTWVRARLYEPDRSPGPVASAVYLALDPALQDFESNLPVVVIDTFPFNLDGEADSASRPFRPVLSVFIDTNRETGRARITGAADYAGRGGMHVRGASTTQYPKKQYAFETWDEQGEDKSVSLLGLPSESDWVLYAPYSDKTLMRNHLMYLWSNRIGRYAVRTRFVEMYIDRGGGKVSPDDYRGVYVFMERIKRDENRVAIAELESADESEPEISGGYLLKKDWLDGEAFFRTKVYNDALIYLEPTPEDLTPLQKEWIQGYFDEFEEVLSGENFGDPIDGYAKYIDVASFIDHHLLVEMAKNVDGFVLSTYLYKDRGGKVNMGPLWDYNGALGGANYFCSFDPEGWLHEFDERICGGGEGGARFPADNPNAYHWYERLFQDPAFQEQYSRRWSELRRDSLRIDWMLADIDETVALLTDHGAEDNAVERNFNKWRILDTYVWPVFFVRGTYGEHVEWMKTWLADRLEWMDGALVVPPRFSHPGGRVAEGLDVAMTVPEGEIYYTLNGPDPRTSDDRIAPEAISYDTPIPITENTRIRARALVRGGLWSAMVEAGYFTNLPPLVVTEVMYEPPSLLGDLYRVSSNYEFIELWNAGEAAIDLTGVRVMRTVAGGLRTSFDFTESGFTALAPHAHVVIVPSPEAFRSRYGDEAVVAGAYTGTLSNEGASIVVLGALDEPIVNFAYDSSWYPSASGEGHSLVLRDPTSEAVTWSQKESWRPSTELLGSPGRTDPLPEEEGMQLPGDANQDQRLDLTDGVTSLLFIVTGEGGLPCSTDAGNQKLLDINGDGLLNLADAVQLLNYLFLRGAPPALGTQCVPIAGCPSVCAAVP